MYTRTRLVLHPSPSQLIPPQLSPFQLHEMIIIFFNNKKGDAYKDHYYQTKLGLAPGDEEARRQVAQSYLEGEDDACPLLVCLDGASAGRSFALRWRANRDAPLSR